NFAASAQKLVPLDDRVKRLTGMASEIGPLEFHSLRRAEGPEITFLARSKKSGDWIEVGMMLEPAPGFGVLGLKFEQSEGPGEAAVRSLGSDATVTAEAGQFLKQASDAGEFSGVVLVAKDGKPFFFEAYGLANRDFEAPNRRDTKFNLGSINKVFTQVAVAQLASQGKLALSDTVRKHLPDYPSSVADRITIQELLTMSSGVGDIFGEKYDATPKSRLRELSDYLPLFVDQPLLFEPGTSRRYSNAGYVVLGLIIEKVSGQRYYDYVREHVFRPAGMKDTDAYPEDAIVRNRAVGYTREEEGERAKAASGPPHVNIYALPARSSSAGGGYSTAADLLAFDDAIRHDRLLPAVWTDWFFTDKSNPPAAAPLPRRHGGGGFAGGTAGVNAAIETDLDTGYTIVVLSNLDPPSAERVVKKLRGWLGLS
ncbi:MAG TPA: serine hydrolase domain-containing protein, partial [Thermoanaerobaculia bacterium]|nr:serine hydrolase domain-containing protein [Thermoanaerobaculia bacterium]